MTTLDAIPDISTGKMIYRALGTTSQLRWRQLLVHLWNLVVTVSKSVLHYAASSLKPHLRDDIIKHYMAPCTAATMQTSMAAMAAQANMQTLTYPRDPSECEHPSGLRAYGAGGQSVRICDQCGFRAVIHKGQMIRVQPKASPHARTPLQLPEHISQHSKSKAAGKASSKAAGKSAPPAKSTGSSGQQRSGSGPFLPFSQGYFSEPPQYPNLANMTPSQSWTHQQILQQQVEDQVQRRLQEIGPQVEAQVQQRLEQMAKAKATAPMPSTLTAPVPEIPLDNGSVASWDQVGSQWNQDWNNPSNWDQPYDWTEEIEEQHEDFENDQENYPDMGQEQMSLDGSAL
ncbi:Integrase catalytic domain-containing protein [Durusdinium trenchii]|uniref:Integrase catalytic domain-containing protein n=1 Tax=Durusdinium trenchii TaxID=1381693 RepID=A0ABP0K8V7_9DINO